jgi:type 1 glutamine amidotransferase
VPARLSARPSTRPAGTARVLVFTKTAGFRHESIPDGLAAVAALGAAHGFTVEPTEDAGAFTDANLGGFAAVLFLNTTGDVLDEDQQDAFQRYIRAGGGFAGVHAASDTEHDWPWYGELVGAFFLSHPAIQRATVHVLDDAHPSTRCVPAAWTRRDEWYDFESRPVAGVRILATVDEDTYEGAVMGAPHPIAWAHAFEGGRAWYTAMGHTAESYAEPDFLDHLLGGVLWAAGLAPDSLDAR